MRPDPTTAGEQQCLPRRVYAGDLYRNAAAQRLRRLGLAVTAVAHQGADNLLALEALLTEIALGDVLPDSERAGIGLSLIHI